MKRVAAAALAAMMLLLSGCMPFGKKKAETTTTVTTTEYTQEVTTTTEVTEASTTDTTATTEMTTLPTTAKVTLPYRTTGTTRRTTTTRTTTTTTAKTTVGITADARTIGEAMTAMINRERAAVGEQPLAFRDDLQAYADIRAQEICEQFSHTRPDGSDCFTVFDTGHHHFWALGENIAYGQQSVAEVMEAWMNSSGHRANILSADFNGVAVGCQNIGGVYYWVQLFVYE